jgi:hypothetical protein
MDEATAGATAEVVESLTVCAADGLLDITDLQAVQVGSQYARGKLVARLDAVEATDAQFLAWALERLRRARSEERLRARKVIVGALRITGCLEARDDEAWSTRKRSRKDRP